MNEYKNLGIDVSHHQIPTNFDWEAFEAEYDFLIARCTYGDKEDERFDDFRNKCLSLHKVFGAYHFFRQTQSIASQIGAIDSVLNKVAYGRLDMYPALDLESNERWDGPVNPKLYSEGGEKIADWMRKEFGGCLIYISPAFWTAMGRPSWVLEHHIWTAHWNVKTPSRVDSKQEDIWQYIVKKTSVYPDAIDLNYCRDISLVQIGEIEHEEDNTNRTNLTEEEQSVLSDMLSEVHVLHADLKLMLQRAELLIEKIEGFTKK